MAGRGIAVSTHSLPGEALKAAEGRLLIRIANRPDSSGIIEAGRDASILIAGFTRIGPDIMDGISGLELIISRSSGVDHIDVAYAESKGICVANQPEAIAEAVSEHVVGLVLSSLRRIVEGHDYTISGRWFSERRFLRGDTLHGKTVGVIGMGRIGTLAAYKLKVLGAGRIIYYSRRRKREVEQLLHAEPGSLERLIRESDIIIAALPDTRETRRLLDYNLLKSMKENALLVNVGRGTLISEEDLERIIVERSDIRVALDVHPEEPLGPGSRLIQLAKSGRLILTPHHAGGTNRSIKETAILAVRQAIHYIETDTVWNPVNKVCRESRDIPRLWYP